MSGIASTGVGSEPKTYDHYLKMLHAFAGLYIWEYFTTLDFEWEVYTGRRPWRWSLIPYITTRTLSLISIIIALAEASVTTGINCEAWLRSVVVTAWLGASGASFLLLLRAVGIWGLDRRVVTIAVPFWLVDLTAALYAMTRGRSQWSPLVQTCVLRGTEEYKWSLLMRLIVDCVLLGIMISGVLYKRNGTHLWNMLFIQGLFWISASILLEFPTVIMPFINTNDTWNVMFQYPLRMSRSLFH
ncbi:hypothetical protein BGW80DRAFT_517576 [Lactifluus volemus]|nr:hypothetical protein BGW80DRAFT_517576 [Lactifluus volemus]